jgi:hypothetical protein
MVVGWRELIQGTRDSVTTVKKLVVLMLALWPPLRHERAGAAWGKATRERQLFDGRGRGREEDCVYERK